MNVGGGAYPMTASAYGAQHASDQHEGDGVGARQSFTSTWRWNSSRSQTGGMAFQADVTSYSHAHRLCINSTSTIIGSRVAIHRASTLEPWTPSLQCCGSSPEALEPNKLPCRCARQARVAAAEHAAAKAERQALQRAEAAEAAAESKVAAAAAEADKVRLCVGGARMCATYCVPLACQPSRRPLPSPQPHLYDIISVAILDTHESHVRCVTARDTSLNCTGKKLGFQLVSTSYPPRCVWACGLSAHPFTPVTVTSELLGCYTDLSIRCRCP